MRRVNREQMKKGGMRELSVSNRGRQEKIHDWVKKEFLLLFPARLGVGGRHRKQCLESNNVILAEDESIAKIILYLPSSRSWLLPFFLP